MQPAENHRADTWYPDMYVCLGFFAIFLYKAKNAIFVIIFINIKVTCSEKERQTSS